MAGTSTMRPMASLPSHAFLATRLAMAAVLFASVVACAGMPDVLQGLDGSATAPQLNAPWQPNPMRPSAAIVAEADRVCRTEIQFQPGLPLVLVDARGEGRLQLFYGAPNGDSGECNGIFVAPGGTVKPGGGGSSGSAGPWQAIAANDLLLMSSGAGGDPLGEHEQYVSGRAGAAVARVQLSVAGIADPIEATVANGWWAAWWPGAGACQGAAALTADGSELGSIPAC
jgi:hypothetical protein